MVSTTSLVFGAVVALVVVVVLVLWMRRRPETYLVYPYLDLDEPGVRGSPYAMTTCSR